MISRRTFLAAAGGALVATQPLMAWAASRSAAADTLYLNGRVWTGLPGAGPAQAIAVAGNRIVYVGDNDGARAHAGRRTRIVDLGGAFVMPGIIDNHTHFQRSSFMLSQAQLRDAATREEFVERVGKAAHELPAGRWLRGGNWDAERWGGELPTRHWIDPVTGDVPVAVVRLDQHLLLANSVAMRLAGVTRDTPDPEGGVIGRDEDGEPNGLFRDRAKALVEDAIPPSSHADIEAALKAGSDYALSLGVTQVHITEVYTDTQEALRRWRAKGPTPIRFYSLVPIEGWEAVAAEVASDGRGDDWVRWGGVKGLVDGSLGSRTALFEAPYADDPHNHGLFRQPPERLQEMITGADAAGLHVAIHAIGDRANDLLFDMFAAVVERNGPRDRRFRLEHAQHLAERDIPRFAAQDVIASMQPYHAIDDGRWAERPLGKDRLHGAWAVRSLLDAGARVTFGSDWPVAPLDPLLGLQAAVLRQTLDGLNPDGWVPEQRITMDEALTAYTVSNAHAGFQEDRLGRVAPGMIADLAIFDRDLTITDPAHLHEAKVLRTVVDGGVGYDSGALAG
ncbi:Exoenzymes regulatory protein AepA in lipid-linked oligosaccharide synthesis cluster [plant metagenome]|uniref:Exoenzymes regulatory protein AepA in lipid-linked oligosaccharide synthesis cluster n=1 Tax=plant metagenome TaxID=1297885 RepID=A0A484SHM3_9ZZZZ